MFTGHVLHAGLEMLPVMSTDISLQGWLQDSSHALTHSPMQYDSATPPVHWWSLVLLPWIWADLWLAWWVECRGWHGKFSIQSDASRGPVRALHSHPLGMLLSNEEALISLLGTHDHPTDNTKFQTRDLCCSRPPSPGALLDGWAVS